MKNLNIWKIKRLGLFRKIKYSWQRITKGYCDYDLTELCDYLAQLMSDSLNEFKKSESRLSHLYDSIENICKNLNGAIELNYDTLDKYNIYKKQKECIAAALEELKDIWLKLWL